MTLEPRNDIDDVAVEIPVGAYVSPDYARAEKERLWDRVWQIACREEEIPEVGDYCTYDVLENSAIVVRSAPDTILAFHNSCRHRGRRLANDCGKVEQFRCAYHAWQYGLDGACMHIPRREHWGGQLREEDVGLGKLRVGRWAGYVWINFDPECVSLEDYLGTMPSWIDPYRMEEMRYKWRRWSYLDCNWKVILEAFIETYHAPIIHPQNREFSRGLGWTRGEGLHSCMGTMGREGSASVGMSVDGEVGKDYRKTANYTVNLFNDTMGALTTDRQIAAATMLFDVLPESASPGEVSAKLTELAREMDRTRGVIWPEVSAEHMRDTGFNWHAFPNSLIQPGLDCGLGIRVRPNGYDPDSCIFEVFALERFPDGEAPATEHVFEPELSVEKWGLLFVQDFDNLPDVQRGMKCSGRQMVRPNPVMEKTIINFHRNLANYMGEGAPEPLGNGREKWP
jgi:nitrite reductase/ring-hydroxylating ferredoxin subunit